MWWGQWCWADSEESVNTMVYERIKLHANAELIQPSAWKIKAVNACIRA